MSASSHAEYVTLLRLPEPISKLPFRISMAFAEKSRELSQQIARYEQLLEAWRNVQSEASLDVTAAGEMRLKRSSDVIAALERSHKSACERLAFLRNQVAQDGSK